MPGTRDDVFPRRQVPGQSPWFLATAAERDAAARLLVAMAQRQSQQIDETRGALAQAKAFVKEQLPTMDAPDLGVQWVDPIIVEILSREAQALIEGDSTTVLDTSTTIK